MKPEQKQKHNDKARIRNMRYRERTRQKAARANTMTRQREDELRKINEGQRQKWREAKQKKRKAMTKDQKIEENARRRKKYEDIRRKEGKSIKFSSVPLRNLKSAMTCLKNKRDVNSREMLAFIVNTLNGDDVNGEQLAKEFNMKPATWQKYVEMNGKYERKRAVDRCGEVTMQSITAAYKEASMMLGGKKYNS